MGLSRSGQRGQAYGVLLAGLKTGGIKLNAEKLKKIFLEKRMIAAIITAAVMIIIGLAVWIYSNNHTTKSDEYKIASKAELIGKSYEECCEILGEKFLPEEKVQAGEVFFSGGYIEKVSHGKIERTYYRLTVTFSDGKAVKSVFDIVPTDVDFSGLFKRAG